VWLLKIFVNIDGGCRGNPGPAAAAMVITDEEGKVMATKSKFLGPGLTNNFAEWSALEGAVNAMVHLAGEHDGLTAEVFADSELVVRQFNRQYKMKEPTLREIAERVWESLAMTPGLKLTLSHVPREENKLADAAVKHELDSYMEWLEQTKK
jgi:ribonuclease HI